MSEVTEHRQVLQSILEEKFLFEPISEETRSAIADTINAYLNEVKAKTGLYLPFSVNAIYTAPDGNPVLMVKDAH